MNPYVMGGAACFCVVLNLVIGLLIGAVAEKWNCK